MFVILLSLFLLTTDSEKYHAIKQEVRMLSAKKNKQKRKRKKEPAYVCLKLLLKYNHCNLAFESCQFFFSHCP